MSSNLTISYTSLAAPGTSPGGATAADAPAADSPLGFLAALLDQVLAGGAEPAAPADTTTADLPGLTSLPFGNDATPPAPPATGPDPLADLTAQLDALRARIAEGNSPTREQLQRLSDTADALAAAIATPAMPAPRPAANSAGEQIAQLLASLNAATANPGAAQPVADARGKLLTFSQSLAATAPALSQKLEALAAALADVEASPELLARLTGQPADDSSTIGDIIRALLGQAPAEAPALDSRTTDATPVGDELLQLLATLGLSAAPSTASATAAAPADSAATTAISPALLRLSNQLSQLGSVLADSSPDLAQKLDAIATKLVSAGADPQLFVQLTAAAADPDGTTLDRLIQNLVDPKPAAAQLPAAPQIAAAPKLDIPASLASDPSAVAEVKTAQPQPTPAPADSGSQSAPRIAVVETPAKPDTTPKPDRSAADIIAETAKADPAAPSTSASQQAAGTVPLVPGAAARALPAAYQPVANPINMGQMAFEMVRQVHQGNSRFTLRLDPPELGRVDVKMHIDNQGAVTARLTVERAETLDLFQRDQRTLERALAQAGLDSTRTSLEFSLRQNPHSGSEQHQQQQQNVATARFAANGDNDNAAMPAVTLYRGIASAGGVNIFA